MLTRPAVLLVLLVLLLLAAGGLAHLLGARRWSALTATIHGRIDAVRQAPVASEHAPDLSMLPPPVARYLRAVIRAGRPPVQRARFLQDGRFNLGTDRDLWRPFDADQVVQVRRPGFDWNARVRLLPGLPIRVHDAYADGTGWLRASLLGVADVADLSGGGAVAEGELMRWLAETPWYPTALLPGQGVHWRAIDAGSAEATVVDGPVRASLVFLFGDDGLVRGVRADARGRTVGGRVVPTPWEGRFWHYIDCDGLRIPTEGEVGWHLGGRFRPYWQGRTVRASYE